MPHTGTEESASSEKSTADDVPDKVDDLSKLRQSLLNSAIEDSYCRSPIYYDFTGRGEIWTIKWNESKDNERLIVLVEHPNIERALLVFFPFIRTVFDFNRQIKQLARWSPFLRRYERVLLARIKEEVADQVLAGSIWPHILPIDEEQLDWVFPSYDISAESLLDPEGPNLSNYRNKIKKFRRLGVEVIPADELPPREFCRTVMFINDRWIQKKIDSGAMTREGITKSALRAPYRALIRTSKTSKADLDGFFLKRGNDYIAFSLWETPSAGDTVPSFASMTSSYEPGLSEYLYRCTAERVIRRHKYICVGGSETAGLDRFKRKFAPVKTHRLRTLEYVVEADGQKPADLPQQFSEPHAGEARTAAM